MKVPCLGYNMIPFKYVAGDHCWESYIALKGLIDKEGSVNLRGVPPHYNNN